VISAPSIFGKLPRYGDFIRHNASLAQVDVWRSWFEQAGAKWLANGGAGHAVLDGRSSRCALPVNLEEGPVLRRAQPCYFVLKGSRLGFPAAGDYMIGVMVASRDRVGRRYPLVIWQSTSAHWAEQLLSAPAHWLTDAAQLLHDHVQQCSRENFSACVDALWLDYRPRWHDRIGTSFRRLANAQRNFGELAGPSALGCKSLRADWPQHVYGHGSLGSFWQAGADSVLAIDGVPAIRDIVAAIS
jgi:type VI secretion system protein ImpM